MVNELIQSEEKMRGSENPLSITDEKERGYADLNVQSHC